MEKWVKIVFIIIGISLLSTIYNLFMWNPKPTSLIYENHHSILFVISLLIFVITTCGSTFVFVASDEEGGY